MSLDGKEREARAVAMALLRSWPQVFKPEAEEFANEVALEAINALAALAAREEPPGREWRICRLCWEAWIPGGERNDCVCEDPDPFSVFETRQGIGRWRRDTSTPAWIYDSEDGRYSIVWDPSGCHLWDRHTLVYSTLVSAKEDADDV